MTTDALPPVRSAKGRLLLTLVVDTSGSMSQNGAIDQLNSALQTWRTELQRDDALRRTGEIALVTFGKDHVVAVDPSGRSGGQAVEPFVPITDFNPPKLEAGGLTPMVEALQYALQIIAARKETLRAGGVPLAYRPIMHLITDGVPTDESGQPTDRWRDLAPVLRSHEAGNHLLFFALGVHGHDENVLRGLAPESSYHLSGVDFAQVMRLMSASIGQLRDASRNTDANTFYRGVRQRHEESEKMRRWLEDQ
ncbi:vWA domain-containing protein [Phytohabitans houttuyneae]|jgi:uncharacterized protein YegL|uniref:VWFA domain-containing protein n=1 Tax=Phytohabitans houttuyneae TaxID=1076126 RepID=A0A6V8KSR7_9ACTN|nr:VWA domain-containing protein [Phytohabitans houttuyneae]GFJ85698.1 hypothetical protein Phou_098780 [Phytohabitans houttuyneae]